MRWHNRICFAYTMTSSKIRICSNINLMSVKYLFSHSLSCYKVLWIAIRWLHNNIIMPDECPTVSNKHICHCKINGLLALFLHTKTFRIGMSLRTVPGDNDEATIVTIASRTDVHNIYYTIFWIWLIFFQHQNPNRRLCYISRTHTGTLEIITFWKIVIA